MRHFWARGFEVRWLGIALALFAQLALGQAASDSDNDGVIDELDRCPETLNIYGLDENGCSYDDYRTKEKAALVALYNATNGDGWTNNIEWRFSPWNQCLWEGVTCNSDRFVISLDLSNNQLSGSMPAELGDLLSLQRLDLSKNQLTGSIPAELGNLTSLQSLSLGRNQLTGSIPAELGNLGSLRWLYLFDNQLMGSIPPELGNLSSLRRLGLNDNRLTESIPPELGNLSSLQSLYLWNNQLTGSIPAELGNLSSLESLDLYDNLLTGSIPAEVEKLAALEVLNLRNNQLTGSIPAALGNLSLLRYASLSDNQLTGSIPPELGNLSSLQSLYLQHNQLTGSIPPELGNLSSLQDLYLQYNELSGVISERLGDFIENLSSYDLSSNSFYCPYPSALDQYFAQNGETCVEKKYTVTPSAGSGGSISPSAPQTVDGGITISFALVPDSGYEIDSVDGTCGGTLLGTTYTTDSVVSDCTVEASFSVQVSPSTYIVTPSAGSGGSISPSSPQTIEEGSTTTFTVSPNSGYEIDTVSGNCDGTLSGSTYTTAAVTQDCTVIASFAEIPPVTFTVTPSAGNGGSISPSSPLTVEEGSSATFGVTPNSGFEVDTVSGTCGGSFSLSDSTFTTNPVSQDCTVVGSFRIIDSDDDGVADGEDQCPSTSDGEVVNEVGCSESDYVAKEKAVLIALYDATNGDDWSAKTHWLSEEDHCVWYGVVCNDSGRVEALSLSSNQLTGSIPAELGNLTSLQGLILYTNQLTGSVPAELGDLSSLHTLDLENNQLTGSIPAVLGNLSSLQYLSLSRNQLTGSIPAELGNLASLYNLRLEDNQLSGGIPAELGNFQVLRFLVLGRNQLTGSIPAELGSLSNLGYMDLNNNQLTGNIPAELGNLSRLKSLVLSNNQLTGGITTDLTKLRQLERLYLNNNELTGGIPPELGNFTSLLEWLNLADNQLTGSIPPELRKLFVKSLNLSGNELSGTIPLLPSTLNSLILGTNNLTGSIPAELGSLSRLSSLVLSNNQFTGSIPAELGNLPSLQNLYLGSNQLTGSIPAELGNLRSLRELDLNSNQLSGVISESLGDYIAELVVYNLSSNEFACPYPNALEQYFAQAGETCVVTGAPPSAVIIERFDYADGVITLTVSASDGGSSITSYDAICTDGTNSFTGSSTTNQIEVAGLTNDVAYTCTVTATNSDGTSEASASTPEITPEEYVPAGLPIWLLKEAIDSAARRSGSL